MKTITMLERLDSEIVEAKSIVDADCKRLERATYISRLGKFAESRSEVEAIRLKYQNNPNVAISSWLNLVDGVMSHLTNMDASSRGKILRAHALSSAGSVPRIRALSAAWLAHMDYLKVDVVSLARHVQEALEYSCDEDHSARSRVSLVLGQAHHFGGRLDLALPWYKQARLHAVAEADEATLSALIHNMAWLRAQRLRATDCGLAPDLIDIEANAFLSVESSANFDLMIGSTSLPRLVPILRAQVLTVRKQYSEALQIFEAEMASAIRDGMGRLQADLVADQAWCRFQCGQTTAAENDAELAVSSIDIAGHFDDRALAYARLAQIYDAVGKTAKAEANRKFAVAAWSAHTLLQAEVIGALKVFERITEPPN